MHPSALVLVLIAAFAHATWNFAAKRIGDGGGVPFVWLFQTISVAIYVPVAALLGDVSPHPSWFLAAVLSAALHNSYALLLQRGYAAGDMSVVYPVARGTGPLVSVPAAMLVLGERPGPLALVGAAAVVLGVFVIGLGAGEHRAFTATSVRWGVLTGLGIVPMTLWDAYSVRTLGVPPLGLFCSRAIIQVLMLTPPVLWRRERVGRLWRAHRREVLAVAVLGPLASVLVLQALRLAPVSMVAPTRELSIVLGALIAWRWLGEPNPARRLTGAVVVLAGIATIAVAG
jgi:drug/metabolite transporter (DMT)-like permease